MSGVKYYEIKPSVGDSYIVQSDCGDVSILNGVDFFNMFDHFLRKTTMCEHSGISWTKDGKVVDISP
jgi:hypothetical protein